MGGKILLVDDVTMFLEIQKGFLRQSSAQVITARDGLEALDAVKAEKPDLVFMDLHMPNMDGAACCRRLKSDPLTRRLPVVLVSAAGKDEDRELCAEAGCDRFLTKPLDRDLFLNTARAFLPQIDRRERRVECAIPAKFRMFGLTLSCTISDISARGAFVAADYPVEEKHTLDVAFILPDATRTEVRAKARVCWVKRSPGAGSQNPEGFGIEFVMLPKETAGAVAAFVAAAAGTPTAPASRAF